MNNFEARYMKIAATYLDDRIKKLQIKPQKQSLMEDKKSSALKKIITDIFK